MEDITCFKHFQTKKKLSALAAFKTPGPQTTRATMWCVSTAGFKRSRTCSSRCIEFLVSWSDDKVKLSEGCNMLYCLNMSTTLWTSTSNWRQYGEVRDIPRYCMYLYQLLWHKFPIQAMSTWPKFKATLIAWPCFFLAPRRMFLFLPIRSTHGVLVLKSHHRNWFSLSLLLEKNIGRKMVHEYP